MVGIINFILQMNLSIGGLSNLPNSKKSQDLNSDGQTPEPALLESYEELKTIRTFRE